ncbi:hypothetical protein DUNSADRAFT_7868 [Dunaliella salina]|uniref:Right handed beta helix domain-containing protein n=1 Tax=Dunaliella salina TaxID=3046 RepID=A0ABQ7GKG7_DUNSA|nr:hypothetical protein DUNSADRAFT_7868 [Dunaliella salina]|eukprot:KAF5835108.1 hypothetical protein DUNSADRAFT_7868 [Dunaliella salina]
MEEACQLQLAFVLTLLQLVVPVTDTVLEDVKILCVCDQDIAIDVCAGGALHLRSCKVDGGQRACVNVHGTGSYMKAECCAFRESEEGAGVLVQGGAVVELHESSAQNCACGWDICGPDSKLTARGCFVEGNSSAGARITDGGWASFISSRLDGSATSNGLYLDGSQSYATLTSTSASSNHLSNVWVCRGARLEAMGCNFDSSANEYGLDVSGCQSSAMVTECRVSDNAEGNVYVWRGAAVLERCTCNNGRWHGWSVQCTEGQLTARH